MSSRKQNIFKYNQQDATLHNLFISVKCSTCFRRFLRPSSGAQKIVYTASGTLSDLYCYLPRQWQVVVKVWQSTLCCIYSFWAPDDGRRNRLKHVEHFTEINKLCNVASCWLYLKIRYRCTDPRTPKETKVQPLRLAVQMWLIGERGFSIRALSLLQKSVLADHYNVSIFLLCQDCVPVSVFMPGENYIYINIHQQLVDQKCTTQAATYTHYTTHLSHTNILRNLKYLLYVLNHINL